LAYSKYPEEFKEYILNFYKTEFEKDNINSIREFINEKEKYIDQIDPEYRKFYKEIKYSGFYKWIKARDDLKNMMDKPVQNTKHHKKQEEKQEEKTTEQEEKEVEKVEKTEEEEKEPEKEVEGGEELELEKRIEEVDRIETENPESKENRKKSEEVVEKTSSKLNIDSSKLYIGAGVLSAVVLAFMLYSKFKNNKNKEVVPDVQQRQQTAETERQKSRYPTPGEL
jgi:hypothetical protein